MDKQPPHQCPHLSLLNDPSTSHSFASTWNACFHVKVPTVPSFEHQEGVCLTPGHVTCPVYLAAPGGTFPVNLQNKIKAPPPEETPDRKMIVIAGLIAVLVLVVGLAAGIMLFRPAASPVASPVGQTKPVVSQATATPVPLPTSTPTIVVLTLTPTISPTPAPFKPFALETPFQIGDNQFLIHVIQDRDVLDNLSQIYHTTPQIIQAINYELKVPIQVGTLILIRPDLLDLEADARSFQFYQIPDKVIAIDELAKKFNVDLKELKYYNNCMNGCLVSRGDWVLLPHRR